MKNHYADSIYIISAEASQARELKNLIDLRGFDRVKSMTLEQATSLLPEYPPDLIILDADGMPHQGLSVIEQCKTTRLPVIYLAPIFDEDLFLTLFDAGAKDYLVKPVNPSYLVSRVLIALESFRVKEQLSQREVILRDIGVIGLDSNVFSTEYLVKMLKRQVENLPKEQVSFLSLLIVQMEGFDSRLAMNAAFKQELYKNVSALLGQCTRGSDILGEYFEDKFAIILPNTGIEGAEKVSRRILKWLEEQSITYLNEDVPLTVRIGASDFTGCLHYEDLLNKVTDALRKATQEAKPLHLVSS